MFRLPHSQTKCQKTQYILSIYLFFCGRISGFWPFTFDDQRKIFTKGNIFTISWSCIAWIVLVFHIFHSVISMCESLHHPRLEWLDRLFESMDHIAFDCTYITIMIKFLLNWKNNLVCILNDTLQFKKNIVNNTFSTVKWHNYLMLVVIKTVIDIFIAGLVPLYLSLSFKQKTKELIYQMSFFKQLVAISFQSTMFGIGTMYCAFLLKILNANLRRAMARISYLSNQKVSKTTKMMESCLISNQLHNFAVQYIKVETYFHRLESFFGPSTLFLIVAGLIDLIQTVINS